MQQGHSHLLNNLKHTSLRSSQEYYALTNRETPALKLCDSPDQKAKHTVTRIPFINQAQSTSASFNFQHTTRNKQSDYTSSRELHRRPTNLLINSVKLEGLGSLKQHLDFEFDQENQCLRSNTRNETDVNSLPNERERLLDAEFKLTRVYCFLYGIYIAPRPKDIETWDGIIMVRSGPYKGGKFKFQIEFPKEFPNVSPQMQFKSPVYHPLVDQKTNQLDLKALIPKWKSGHHMMVTLISSIKQAFSEVQWFQYPNSYNPSAGKLCKKDIKSFQKNVNESIQLSKKEMTVREYGTALNFTDFGDDHAAILEKVRNIARNRNVKILFSCLFLPPVYLYLLRSLKK